MFNQPMSGSGFFKPAEHDGHLVLITTVHRIERRFDTLRNADIDQATVDLVDLDENPAELVEEVFVTHTGIVNKLRAGATNVLGRVGQVTTKSGMQAWALLPFNEGSDDVKAKTWLDARQTGSFAQPKPETPQPAAQPQNGYTAEQAAALANLTEDQKRSLGYA